MSGLLEIDDLALEFDTLDGAYKALDGVSLTLRQGEALGIVGETGCGKSVTAKSVLGLVPSPPARVTSGRILYRGEDLLKAGEKRLMAMRGVEFAMIFQDPMTYLNPVFTIGAQMTDAIIAHERTKPRAERMTRKAARAHAAMMLEKVHLPNPERQLEAYPHQLSGGMRQRVLIAMALSGKPKILIADEPTTALDVTIQAQILELMKELMRDFELSLILVSHDLGVIATICDQVAVMYAGQVVEEASIAELFDHPRHPYTKGLLAAVPHPGRPPEQLRGIAGHLPNLLSPPAGCRFAERCDHAMAACNRKPALTALSPNHRVACWLETSDA